MWGWGIGSKGKGIGVGDEKKGVEDRSWGDSEG